MNLLLQVLQFRVGSLCVTFVTDLLFNPGTFYGTGPNPVIRQRGNQSMWYRTRFAQTIQPIVWFASTAIIPMHRCYLVITEDDICVSRIGVCGPVP